MYYNRKSTDNQMEGLITEQAIMNLVSDGVPQRQDYDGNDFYSNKPINFDTEIKPSLLNKSIPHKISAY